MAASLLPAPGMAGAYARLVDCAVVVDGFCGQGVDRNGEFVGAHAIVHPPGYDGTQALVDVDVCTSPLDNQLIGPSKRAVAKWEALSPIIGKLSFLLTA